MVGETRVHKNINKYGPRQRWAPQLKNSLFIFLMFLSSLQLLVHRDSRTHLPLTHSPSFLVCTGSSLAAGNGLYVARSSLSLPIFSAASSSPTGVPRDWVSVSSR